MFTGIITSIGTLLERDGGRLVVRSDYPAASIEIGASIAHDGACLTVKSIQADGHGSRYALDVSNETFSKTTLGGWRVGTRINLERALRIGDELGGHIVTGHVDGVAGIVALSEDGVSRRLTLEAPAALAPFIASKGSVALDGASLTVNEVEGTEIGGVRFGVNLIPHTLTVTTWGSKKIGDQVNLEIDPLARYVARLMEMRR